MADYTVPCIDCSKPTSARAIGIFQECTGFTEYRGKTGGANNLKFKTYTGRIICPECATLRKNGISAGQGDLFS